MRFLLAIIVVSVLFFKCSNLYPVFLTTPVAEDSVIIDTIIPVDSIDSIGYYISRDTILHDVVQYEHGFYRILMFSVLEDVSSFVFSTQKSYARNVEFIVNDKSVPYATYEAGDYTYYECENIVQGSVFVRLDSLNKDVDNVLERAFLRKSDTIKHINAEFGAFVGSKSVRCITVANNKTVDSVSIQRILQVESGDTVRGVVESNTNLDVFIVDSDNRFNFFLGNDVTYLFRKTQINDTVNFIAENNETLYYIVYNPTDTTIIYSDSISQVR